MDATIIAYYIVGFLMLVAILSAVDSAKVTALKDRLFDAEQKLMGEDEAYKLGHKRGYEFGVRDCLEYAQQPWNEDYAHIAEIENSEYGECE